MKRRLLFVLLALPCLCANAQDTATRPYRHFATQLVQKQLLEQDAGLTSNLDAMEQFIRDYGEAGNDRSDTIPIVFHILYRPGTTYPGVETVTALVDALNHDFGAYEGQPDAYEQEQLQAYAALARDPLIRFCTPVAGSTAPVEFVPANLAEWPVNNDMKSSLTGGADPYDPAKCLNIWVCQLEGNVAGFAQMPGGPGETDGIVIDYDYLSGFVQDATYPYKQAKTLSHLVGSYLGLYELWDDEHHCADDQVADTPIHNAPNFDVPLPGVRHISLCPMGPVDEMYMNIMDNTDDVGQNMFTLGQKSRMKAVLSNEGPRAKLKYGVTACSGQNLEDAGIGLRGSTATSGNGENAIKIFPNPTKGNITLMLKANADAADITIYNSFGQRMLSTSCVMDGQRQTLKVECEGWSAGLYHVDVRFSDTSRLNTLFSIAR